VQRERNNPRAGDEAANGSPTILLVEDDDGIRELVREFLVQEGYEVLSATDAPAALRIASRKPGGIDLLLTDVVMPGMDGFDLAERLVHLRPGLKVLAMSGYIRRSTPPLLPDGTPIPILPKPFDLHELRRRVRDLVGRIA